MIVQDTSGSMCEPINHDAGIATDGGGAGDCAANIADESKAGIVAVSMQQVLDKLNPKVNIFYMGLYGFPNVTGPDGARQLRRLGGPVFPIGKAQDTIPQIVTWYQGMPNKIGAAPQPRPRSSTRRMTRCSFRRPTPAPASTSC